MKAELWHAGHLNTLVEGSLAPRQEPIAISFLVVAPGEFGQYHYAYSEHGEIADSGEARSSGDFADKVRRACVESARTNVPLVVVLAQPDASFFASAIVEAEVKDTIRGSKSREVKRQVVLPRLLTVSERESMHSMFGERDRSRSYYAQVTEELVGFSLQGEAKAAVWCIGLAHSLARSSLGREVSPRMDKGAKYV